MQLDQALLAKSRLETEAEKRAVKNKEVDSLRKELEDAKSEWGQMRQVSQLPRPFSEFELKV